MQPLGRVLLDLAERSLRVEIVECGISAFDAAHDTGWRVLPGWIAAQIDEGATVVELAGRPVESVAAPDCALIPAQHLHRSRGRSDSGLSRWSVSNPRIFATVDVLSLFDLPPKLVGAAARRVGEINAALVAQRAAPADLRGLARRQETAFALLRELIEPASPRPEAATLLAHAERLAPVLAHIEANLARPLSRAGLARLASLSPSRFHALFRAATGAAPLDYVLGLRLQRAQRLLIATERSVQDIAAAAGFADPFHFSRLFKRRCGAGPQAWRRAARRGA